MQKQVSVLGPSSPSQWVSEQAYELGVLLAQRGYTVVNGGYNGVMEDVSRGATSVGGAAIGITVTEFPSTNPYLTEKIGTDFFSRLSQLLEMPRIFFSPQGSVGSVLEMAAALHKTLFQKQPTIMILEDQDEVLEILQKLFGKAMESIAIVHSAEEAVAKICA